MSTKSFETAFVINDIESAKRLYEIMLSDESVPPLSNNPFSSEDRKRGEDLLKRIFSKNI